MSRCQEVGQKHNIKITNKSFEDVAKLKYLGKKLTEENCMNEEIKYRLNSGNACYRSVHLLYRNVKVKIYKTTTLSVILYGCKTWSLTLREDHRLRVFENRVLRIFGPKRNEVTGDWRKLHNEELHVVLILKYY
jgi:hypothetical protein